MVTFFWIFILFPGEYYVILHIEIEVRKLKVINKGNMMPKSIIRTYSGYSREAAALLGALIREARIERRITAQDLAERAGISRGFLGRIEKGDLKCEIGVVFEVATIVGIKLFDADQKALTGYLHQAREKLALLPKSVRKKSKVVHDDF